MEMKCSHYVADRVKEEVDTVFGVTGGNIVNVVDSFHKAGLRIVPMHHEQSAAIAADAYARFKGFGVCYATSGPGITNLMTGVACSYFDSIPVLVLGGQVPRKFLTNKDRQMGFQEVDGVNLMKPITKYSERMDSPFNLEVAIHTAKEHRKGPSFIEIPDDYQRSQIKLPKLPIDSQPFKYDARCVNQVFGQIVSDLANAKKPLVIVGAGARDMPLELEIPFLYTWAVKDKFFNHPYCKGDFGTTGSPNGNRMTRESDLILMIGTRMDSHKVPNWEDFAPNTRKIAIGLEFPHEAEKINCVLDFPLKLKGRDWGKRMENTTDTTIYRWVDYICRNSFDDEIIIPDMGQTGCIVLQRWKIKEGQRLFNAFNHSPMGYSLPAAIGAHFATGRPIRVIIGDGSLMMNLHDLQTISDYKIPIQIHVINNGGYGMLRQTQEDWKQYLAQKVACNFRIPKIMDLAYAFGIPQLNFTETKFEDTRIKPKWKYGRKL